jgi:hypothetical protein
VSVGVTTSHKLQPAAMLCHEHDSDENIPEKFKSEAVHTSETSVDNHFTRQYIPEDNSEHHTRRRENLKSHTILPMFKNEKHKSCRLR